MKLTEPRVGDLGGIVHVPMSAAAFTSRPDECAVLVVDSDDDDGRVAGVERVVDDVDLDARPM